MVSRRVHVTGRVQGVFYRAWTLEEARRLSVRGWIRNRSDGSVEAQLEGNEAAVEELIARMRKGPPDARVERLDFEETAPQHLSAFELRH